MNERRIVFNVGVTYQTSREQLQRIPEIIQRAIEKHDKARFERSHFKSFGDSALVFETVFYIQLPDYALYMDIQQSVNLELFEEFQKDSIEFAYPTQTIFLEQSNS
jgi:small-conductance mechanosensitive channel